MSDQRQDMRNGDIIQRGEFSGYVERHAREHERHESAPLAHSALRDKRDEELKATYGVRLTEVEETVQRVIGGLIVLGALLGGGMVTFVIGLVLHIARII